MRLSRNARGSHLSESHRGARSPGAERKIFVLARIPIFLPTIIRWSLFLSFGCGIEDSHHSAEGAGFAYALCAYLRREEQKAITTNKPERLSQNSPRAAYPYSPSAEPFARHGVRIPRPKIGKLACQAQGVGIFAKGEYPYPPKISRKILQPSRFYAIIPSPINKNLTEIII